MKTVHSGPTNGHILPFFLFRSFLFWFALLTGVVVSAVSHYVLGLHQQNPILIGLLTFALVMASWLLCREFVILQVPIGCLGITGITAEIEIIRGLKDTHFLTSFLVTQHLKNNHRSGLSVLLDRIEISLDDIGAEWVDEMAVKTVVDSSATAAFTSKKMTLPKAMELRDGLHRLKGRVHTSLRFGSEHNSFRLHNNKTHEFVLTINKQGDAVRYNFSAI